MKVLVIGGSGQIGHELCCLFDGAGISYHAPLRDELDLVDHKSVALYIKTLSPDFVINTAGYRDAGHATWEPSRCFSINRDAVANLAKVCARENAALVQISSWRIFNGQKKDSYTEKDTPDPESVLGNAFWQGEQQVSQHCPRHIILRLSWIIGEVGHNRVTRLLKSFTAGEVAGTCPLHRGFPTTAADVARVLLAITQQLSCGINVWGTYHYSSAEAVDEYTLAEMVLAEASQYFDVDVNSLPIDKKDNQKAVNACLDSKRLTYTFGIKPRSWKEELPYLVKCYYQKLHSD